MQKFTFALCLGAIFYFVYPLWAEELITPQRAPAGASDVAYPAFDDSNYDKPAKRALNKDGHDGLRIQFYYDPLSSYSKITTLEGVPSQFSHETTTGNMGGVQLMWSVWAPSDFEFQTGLDYVFPVDVQDQQSIATNYLVNSQTLNVIGFKVIQVNYRFNFGGFTLAPYGGLGIYYGKNSVNIINSFSNGQTDMINYTKLMAVYTVGARVDYNFNRAHTIAAGLGIEFFVPTKLADQLSQSGSTTSELPGTEPYLQSNLDFMTGVGARLLASVAGYF